MKILAISHLFPNVGNKHFGIFAARQFATMKQLGADVTVLVPTVWVPGFLWWLRPTWKNLEQNRMLVRYDELETIAVPYLRLTRGFWSCRWEGLCVFYSSKNKVLELHRKIPFDVIFGRGFFPGADVGVRLAKTLKIPVVGFGIGSDVNVVPHYSRSMYRHFVRVAKLLDGALGHGRGVADKIAAVTGRQTPTVHGIVDLNAFAPPQNKTAVKKELNISSDNFVMLYIGGLTQTKGVYEMLDAFCRVKDKYPQVMLKICGTGQEEEKLREKIRTQNPRFNVELLGAVEPDKVAKWMQASDVLILPSYSEGMPNVVMEAMACGLPVISTKVGGLPDAVGDCDGVILVEPKNVGQLASAMEKLVKDENVRRYMGIEARKRAVEKFGNIENVQKILDYIIQIVEKHKKVNISIEK